MKRLCVVAVIAGCSGLSTSNGVLTDANKPDAEHGSAAPTPDAGPPQPQTITIQPYEAIPTFVAYRAGSGAWMTPTTTSQGYAIVATDDYLFVAVCTSTDGSLDEVELGATVSDGATNYVGCTSDDDAGSGGATVAVTGTMQQAGNVQMGGEVSSTTAPWTFSLNVPPSTTQDLVAIGASSMLIRRNIAVTATATQPQPAIDLSADGTALLNQAISVTGTPADDTAQTSVFLYTANSGAEISTGTSMTSVVLAPSALMQSGDEETIDVYAFDATTFQDSEVNDPTVTQFAMLPQLQGVTFTGTTSSWTTLPQANSIYSELYETNGTITKDAIVQMSPTWLAATSATSVAFDDSAAGWQAAWSFWTSVAYQEFFAVEEYSQTTFQSVGVSTPPNGFRDRRVHHRRHR